MIEIKEAEERVILLAVSEGDGQAVEQSLDELEELIDTAGGITLAKVTQNLEHQNPATYIGKGKIEEVKELLWELDATGVVCDDELSPVQLRNLESMLETKIMDRTMVILDIFAAHAMTSEGKIQVELAQLRYRAARLVGLRNSLSRLGGGIGTRGPGEKKLEIDRRLIHQRIGQLKQELEAVKKHREVARQRRDRNYIPVAAIVGYTNAGKSTLLNKLTGAEILAEDKLFATLDPTTRVMKLDSGEEILLTDTVGFIRKLPHHLIDAFRSTLEEAKYCDILIHVVDASNPMMDTQMHVVYDTLRELGVEDKIGITLFNKQDRLENPSVCRDFKADYVLPISAKTGEGLNDLSRLLEQILREQKIYVRQTYSYSEAGKIQLIRKYGQLLEEKYTENGIEVTAFIPAQFYSLITSHSNIKEV